MDNDVGVLLKRIKSGDESAFNQLAEKYSKVVDAAVRSFSPSFDAVDAGGVYTADDLRQHAMLALFRAAQTYDADDKGKEVSFGLYAKICVNNSLISVLRKYRSEKKRREAMKNIGTAENRSRDPLDQIVDADERRRLLGRVSEVLSPYEKEVFEFLIVGKSACEIAGRLGKSVKSVSNAVFRIKVKTKELLKN